MDLVCANKVRTGTMISAHYIAFGISGMLLFSMAERYGRRFSVLINYLVYTAAGYLIVFDASFWARLCGFTLYGLAQMKGSLTYVWLAELVPAAYRNTCTVCITCFDASTMAVVGLYFLAISKDWFPLMLFVVILSTISLILAWVFIPETPSWFISQGRVSDAIKALNQIAWINGSMKRIPTNAVFEESQMMAE